MAIQKTRTEIRNIQKACQITDEIFVKIIDDFYFKTERELMLFIRREIRNHGLREAFPPIVTSGVRAGNDIHPKSTKDILTGFVIIDFGVRVEGYCSDMTRTIYVGTPSVKERVIYEKVLQSKKVAERASRAGVECARSDKEARKTLGQYKKYFIHMLGHGVGKRIHESPKIFFKRPDVYQEDSVITIEPGVYIKNKLGIRIEDTYIVGTKSLLPLTHSPQKLLIFGKRD